MYQAPMNRAWSMLVNKPAKSWLIRMRLPPTGADFKMVRRV